MSDEMDMGPDPEMYELFREETASHVAALERDLVRLETHATAETLESLMRAAHSIKGAARIIGLNPAVGLAHRMEDFFVAMQEGRATVDSDRVDLLLRATDFYKRLRTLAVGEVNAWLEEQAADLAPLEEALSPREDVSSRLEVEATSEPSYGVVDANMDMIDLFKMELQAHLAVLRKVPSLAETTSADPYEELSRAAHSIKGAARIVGLEGLARLAHAMEDCFGILQASPALSPVLAGDLIPQTLLFLTELEALEPNAMPGFLTEKAGVCERYANDWRGLLSGAKSGGLLAAPMPPPEKAAASALASAEAQEEERSLLVSTETLDRLTGLAGEAWVESRRLEKHVQHLFELRESHRAIEKIIRSSAFSRGTLSADALDELRRRVADTSEGLTTAWRTFQRFGFGTEELTSRLYNAAVAARMRPLAEGLKAFPRLVRDMARQLDKKIRFETVGGATRVDRDVLSQMDAPLTHILRNACDHGIESVPERLAAGKPEQGVIRVEGSHRGGMLIVAVSDDGRGMDVERIKAKVIQRNMAGPEWVERMSREELLEFLFLPGFSTASSVTEYSGRGVGMDVVRTMVQRMGGTVHLRTALGEGSVIELRLPLSLALLRTLHVELDGEAYAFPLARVNSVRRVRSEDLLVVDDRLFLNHARRNIPVMKLAELLQLPSRSSADRNVSLVLCGEGAGLVAFAVDRIVEEKDLVVHPLDHRLGAISSIHSGAIMEDGAIALVLDPDDLLRIAAHSVQTASAPVAAPVPEVHGVRRVLVVDDSITVREVERRLLERHGCRVDLAVDGLDGWEKAHTARYDLILSDVDMPRLNGIEFVTRLKQDPMLKEIPVIIVSYKDQEEDRIRGLKAGANYYLTKSSFQDETLIKAVQYLIGDL